MLIITLTLLTASLIYIVLLRKDIRHLNRQLHKISTEKTNLRLTTESGDKEVKALAVSINGLLKSSQQRVRESEQANRELRQGITNVSHDLRTPLTSALGFLQLLETGTLPEDKQKAYVEIIKSRLLALNGLMKDLFHYTQLLEDKVAPKLEQFNLSELLQNQIAHYYGDFQNIGLTPTINIPEQAVFTIGDVQMMERVLANLLKNVVSHGTGFCEIQLEPGKLVLINGVKNPLDTDRLFERFYTTDSARSGGGTGLGLPIVKELLGMMGKTVEAKLRENRLSITVYF